MHNQPIYLPNEIELIAARGAIVSIIDSIEAGHLKPTSAVLDEIIKAVVVSMLWRPQGL